MIEPARLILNGRMSDRFADQKIDFFEIQKQSAIDYLSKILPHFDPINFLEILSLTNPFSHTSTWYRPRSIEDVPDAKNPYANDTSVCVAYWPLSYTEKLTMEMERFFYQDGAPKFNFIGQDMKIMSVRKHSHIHVTMCIPFICDYTPDASFYKEKEIELCSSLIEKATIVTEGKFDISIDINTQDNNPFRYKPYLLATGTCLECGEEGVVGRGNKVDGLISSMRPHSMEAAFGKNPVYHTGRVYGYLTNKLARAIATQLNCECNVFAITQNGGTLIPPYAILVETSGQRERKALENIVEKILFSTDYVDALLFTDPIIPREVLARVE